MKAYMKKSIVHAEPFDSDLVYEGIIFYEGNQAKIKTKQGIQNVNEGDFLVHNPDGEVYPCNAITFLETYVEVTE